MKKRENPSRCDCRGLSVLAVFMTVVVIAGIVLGITTAPGDWYASLDKPSFNPPNWIFAPVWTVLYLCIAAAGARLWLAAPRSLAMKFWFAQLAVNWLWSPVFFALHLLWPALVICLLMWALILAVILTAWRCDRLAGWLMAPYLLWVSFACILNAAVAWLN